MSQREVGIVKWYDEDEGCGFIACRGGMELFVHYSAIRCEEGRCYLRIGDPVEFMVIEGANGPQAQDVVVLDKQ